MRPVRAALLLAVTPAAAVNTVQGVGPGGNPPACPSGSGQACVVNCNAADRCQGANITCPADAPCRVECQASDACMDAVISNCGSTGHLCTVLCNGTEACLSERADTCSALGRAADCSVVPSGALCYSDVTGAGVGGCFATTRIGALAAAPAAVDVTQTPSRSPTAHPTRGPTGTVTAAPTAGPTRSPTVSPTRTPTGAPTKQPSGSPTRSPTTPMFACVNGRCAAATVGGTTLAVCTAACLPPLATPAPPTTTTGTTGTTGTASTTTGTTGTATTTGTTGTATTTGTTGTATGTTGTASTGTTSSTLPPTAASATSGTTPSTSGYWPLPQPVPVTVGPTAASADDDSAATGAIIGGVLGGLVGLILLCCLYFYYCGGYWQGQQRAEFEQSGSPSKRQAMFRDYDALPNPQPVEPFTSPVQSVPSQVYSPASQPTSAVQTGHGHARMPRELAVLPRHWTEVSS
eukprot:TRINITY_DN3082_c0_g1_i1.p1 TRINITY_DN3082_c0_g1~~TRINITY_DN3082_c0_g1_i1.p1  ORF type:complete len:463 (+),score=100.66 TRINITY_DN3082_c0_g1_i1:57-1445(+)